ncbi:hypothetical protein ACVIW2_001225 [Bradyrhizobium huanghuaihaiense]|uniref:hypothetical protein n=1 Tax=Bradyrhizobium huanghuaihaiense TaxID=990078 RepID=UPI00119EA6B4|nr:hypothetical protein [Bradyrhizobium huanghuaihaiense]
MFVVFFPKEFGDHWAKAASAVIAFALILPIVYLWTFRTLPEDQKPTVGLSPLYFPEGRRHYRAEQQALKQQRDQLEAQIVQLAAEMKDLDLTSQEGQQRLKQLSERKSGAERKLAAIPKPGAIGFG